MKNITVLQGTSAAEAESEKDQEIHHTLDSFLNADTEKHTQCAVSVL